MSLLDISTYIIQNNVLVPLALTIGVILFSFGPFLEGINFETGAGLESFKTFRTYTLSLGVIITIVAAIPTHEAILKLKISKIKNETVTQENLDAGINEVKKIGKKLECKYLDICEGKK